MPTDLPNLLTLSRIAAIPVLVALVAVRHPWGDVFACIVFSTAAITDYFDGKIARERRSISSFGRMLDPIADKLLVGAALMLLAGMGRLSDAALFPPSWCCCARSWCPACASTSRGSASACR